MQTKRTLKSHISKVNCLVWPYLGFGLRFCFYCCAHDFDAGGSRSSLWGGAASPVRWAAFGGRPSCEEELLCISSHCAFFSVLPGPSVLGGGSICSGGATCVSGPEGGRGAVRPLGSAGEVAGVLAAEGAVTGFLLPGSRLGPLERHRLVPWLVLGGASFLLLQACS